MLDSYFASTANLGTHTFFMIMLPIQFWCGYTEIGLATVHLLAFGVILSGMLKDALCLPRPHSPPLTRITMSGSVALEYGFPSTHSTNAVSIAVYVLYMLHNAEELDERWKMIWQGLCYLYAGSIMVGRIYCGMHGFFDVAAGTALGAIITVGRIEYGPIWDWFFRNTGMWGPLTLMVFMLLMVKVHPEPADDCPCFDDSVAFAGVVFGVETGALYWSMSPMSIADPVPGTVPYSLEQLGLVRSIVRVVLGVALIVGWRSVAKKTMLRVLPPIFRRVEQLRADMPRRFFLKASEYKKVPPLPKDDNVIPSPAQIPQFISNIKKRRGRAVSIGPQSVADAYEAVAYREEQRKRSGSAGTDASVDIPEIAIEDTDQLSALRNFPAPSPRILYRGGNVRTPLNLPISLSSAGEQTQGWTVTPLCNIDERELDHFPDFALPPELADEFQHSDHDLLRNVAKVRVRYDVEVVTKLVVYAGIGYMATCGVPSILGMLGLNAL